MKSHSVEMPLQIPIYFIYYLFILIRPWLQSKMIQYGRSIAVNV